jgi:arginyl-tRNA synthetase
MKDTIRHLIQQALSRLTADGVLPEGLTPAIQVENTRDKSHGDFASNIAMMLAKPAGLKPRDLAEKLIAALPSEAAISKVEIAGPGFLNFYQDTQALAARLDALLADAKLGVCKAGPAQRVVVDLSAPNLAKEMHVGHLRSTVIGDALVRTLEFAGHRVIRANHLGDWGTQFGMLTQHMLDSDTAHLSDFTALGELYREAKARFDADADFADRARLRVVALQAGDAETIALWQDLVDVSLAHINHLYGELDVTLTDEHVIGESFYNARLAGTVEALLESGVAVESDGAVVIASERFVSADGSPTVLMIRKSDGGYGYGTTDLTALRYRVSELHADRMVYVTDARQAQHFAMVFAAAERAVALDVAREDRERVVAGQGVEVRGGRNR